MTTEPIKHDWARDENGEIDVWQVSYDYHNGPRCVRCGHMFCHRCSPEDYDEPCDEQTPYLGES